MNKFSAITKEVLKYYVYVLIDPRDNYIFYVGEGYGDRVFDHEKEVENNYCPEKEKHRRIKEIQDAGLKIIKMIGPSNLRDQKEAQNVETGILWILKLQGHKLTNIQSGHHENYFKFKTVEEIEYQLATNFMEQDKNDKIIYVNVSRSLDLNKTYTEDEYKELFLGDWIIDKYNLEKANKLCVCYNGIIRKVYSIDSYIPVSKTGAGATKWKIKGEPIDDSPYLYKRHNFSFRYCSTGVRFFE
ncbi:MAG: hypothetical protein J1F35_06100 [Erysipelotrichales bacterium]|nr:hypothetical protein [Erysipelotrichales bacterium]